ncbi:MAG: glycoside hydrolase family 3 N-terminal domain-containing protein [Bacillus sp. (in: firmicutes)]
MATSGFSGPRTEHKQPKKSKQEILIYQNLPEAETAIEDVTLKMEAVSVKADGQFMKAGNVKWKVSNKKVATITNDGMLKLTGKQGSVIITATKGKQKDTAHLIIDSKGKTKIRKPKGKKYDLVSKAVRNMTLEEKIGQMLMPDYRKWKGENVTEMLPEIEQQVKDLHLGGVILFRENVVETEQTARLVDAYQKASDKFGMFISIDQEGGIVTRLQSGTDMPGNMALGAGRSTQLASDVGRAIGEELHSLGINVNFAPTLDVNNNSDNPVIGVRSFSEDPQLTAEMGVAYIKGMQETGVVTTAKHFPGHGDTNVDSHVGLPEVPHDMERLKQIELYPFQKAMDAGVDAIMSAHITFPKVDPTKVISKKTGEEVAVPATLSNRILTGLMRKEMNYKGLIVTDAMEMAAITEHFGTVDAAIMSVKAGTDIVLMPVGLQQVRDGLVEAVENGEISKKRIDESVKRILSLKLKRGIMKEEKPLPVEERIEEALQVVGSDGHKQIEQAAAERSITLVKNSEQVLPLAGLDPTAKIAVIGSSYIQDLGKEIKKWHDNTDIIVLPATYVLTPEQESKLREADYIIVGSHTANVASRLPDHPQMARINDIIKRHEAPVITVAIRNPYDVMAFPDTDAYLTQYGFRTASFRATAAVIFGQINPAGKLPVTIPDGNGSILYPFSHGLSYQ